jgi:ankyrin repeat protein
MDSSTLMFYVAGLFGAAVLVSAPSSCQCNSVITQTTSSASSAPTDLPPILIAVKAGEMKTVKDSLDADPAAVNQTDRNGNNAAHLAILEGRDQIFFEIVARGYPITDAQLFVCCCSRDTEA